MYLQKTQYSLQKKQWNFLSKHLRLLIEQQRFQKFSKAKQTQLIQKLRSLFQKMIRFERMSKLKKALGVAALLLGLQTTPSLQAQIEFNPAVINPFGLMHTGNLSWRTLTDVDGDGDLDIFEVVQLENSTEQVLNFRENISEDGGLTAIFTDPVQNLLGITLPDIAGLDYSNPEFKDLDNDGDLDLLLGAYDVTPGEGGRGSVVFFENTGDVNNPAFDEAPIENPFNIDFGESTTAWISLADIDDDGDLDLFTIAAYDGLDQVARFVFHENIGTAESANFAAGQASPFNLPDNFYDFTFFDLGDIDNDGDIDIMCGDILDFDTYELPEFTYIENTGTAENADFATPIVNPTTLEGEYGLIILPMLGDLDNDGDLDILTDGGYDYDLGALWTFHENLSNPLAVKEMTLAAEAIVFPNVSSGEVTLQLQANEVQEYYLISIVSTSGQLVRQWTIEGGLHINERIDLATLTAAEYFIQVRTPEGVLVRKITKTK